jgi:dipeptidyl aminopeptidase/acylaminoacyl peptidase
MKKSAIALLLFTVMLTAQVRVSDTQVLDLGKNAIRPVFSNDGKYLLFTSYDGAAYYDIEKEKLNYFSGSASDYSMDSDGNIRFRVDSFVDGMKMNSVKEFDTKTGKTVTILDKKRLDIVPNITDHGVYYIEKNAVKTNTMLAKTVSKPVVMSYDRSLLLYSYGTAKTLKPAGEDKFYIWPSLSPDNSMICFVDINDLYVTDLNGKVKFKINEARAPKWSPDGKWIAFMRDSDDGHAFISSDIYVVRVSDQKVIKLTDTDDRIEMNPSWSQDGQKIVCEDAQNDEILILTLAIR